MKQKCPNYIPTLLHYTYLVCSIYYFSLYRYTIMTIIQVTSSILVNVHKWWDNCNPNWYKERTWLFNTYFLRSPTVRTIFEILGYTQRYKTKKYGSTGNYEFSTRLTKPEYHFISVPVRQCLNSVHGLWSETMAFSSSKPSNTIVFYRIR